MKGHHALVFGAGGIQGWAIVNQILKEYPDQTAFSRVTALTGRSVSLDSTLWPQTGKLHIASGIDLLTEDGQEGLEKRMKEIYDINTVSHVFFCAYVHDKIPKKECELNKELLVRAVTAVNKLSSALRFVVLPTGTKAYGVHLMEEFPHAHRLPLKESLPRIPEPHASENFYYHQVDALKELSAGKAFTWCELRPDVIVGFVPSPSAYCLTLQYAIYLSLFAKVHGKGAQCPWPGSLSTYKPVSNDASQDTIAQFAIFASLHPEACGDGQSFNIADIARPSSWEDRWPAVCEYFGLIGVPPTQAQGEGWLEFLQKHQSTWSELTKTHKLRGTHVLGDSTAATLATIMDRMDFDRSVDITRMLSTGFRPADRPDVETAWWNAFDRFREARIIP